MELAPNSAQEKRSEAGSIHFEPGLHNSDRSELKKIYQDFAHGDLTAHIWHPEVSERIASYAYTASGLLLSIDGLAPYPPSSHPVVAPQQEAINTWISLPARPNILNQTNKVYVLKGDNLAYRLPQAILPKVEEPEQLRQQMDAEDQTQSDNASVMIQQSIIEETTSIMTLGAVLWGASKLLERKMSRRKFLGNMIAVGTAGLVAGSILRYPLPDITASLPNEPTKDFLEVVDNFVRPRLTRSKFSDGRTALLLAKAEDAQNTFAHLSGIINTIVMGAGHGEIAPTYLQDKGERDKAIAAYTGELLDVAKEVYGHYYHISSKDMPTQIIQALSNYLSEVDIVEVTDPGGSSFQPNIPQTIENYIVSVNRFNSPQVIKAIAAIS
jgi:hypothetical protein